MRQLQITVLLLALLLGHVHSSWWSSQSETHAEVSEREQPHRNVMAPFQVDRVGLPGAERGADLLEELKSKLESSCFHAAYVSLYSSCRDVLRDEETKMRLAYKFADCFFRSSGKDPLKPCSDKVPVKECTKTLTDHRHHVLLKFYMDIASICHHLQSEAFKLETEQVVSSLKYSAHQVGSKLQAMQTQSQAIFENSEKVVESQQRVHEEFQAFENNMGAVHEDINKDMLQLKSYAEQTNEEMQRVSSFQKDIAEQQELLTTKAESLNTNVIKSLSSQEELLASQNAAMSSLTELKTLQDNILQESNFLHEVHLSLARESQDILRALEVFSVKQALIFTSLDRLFSLHSAILVESRLLKAFFFYVPVAILIYVLTGTKQTNNARALLYFGLCVSFGAEFWSLHYSKLDIMYQSELLRNSLYIRGFYAVAALSYILYCIVTFKDYPCLSYNLLLDMRKRLDETITFQEPLYTYTDSEGSMSSMMITGPTFKSYEDQQQQQMIENDMDDPDYDPMADSDCEDFQVCKGVRSDYDLRLSARRKGRPLAASVNILDWETGEMFSNLFRSLLVERTSFRNKGNSP